ncbi:MAG: hypothetical protein OXE42_20660 [Gammaproteobacteria bacterium]|nr:hypothetical protein [Gammaproteobacteria bacterium]
MIWMQAGWNDTKGLQGTHAHSRESMSPYGVERGHAFTGMGDTSILFGSGLAGLGRKINPNLTTLSEWRKKLNEENPFISNINKQAKLFIYGSEDELV